MSAVPRIPYDFAVLSAVPHPYVGAFVPVGVVLHARTADYLGARAVTDEAALRARVPDVDSALLARYLRAWCAICDGDPSAGPIAMLSRPERFHWLTAPRSDVLQVSPAHEGVCDDLARELDELYRAFVERAR